MLCLDDVFRYEALEVLLLFYYTFILFTLFIVSDKSRLQIRGLGETSPREGPMKRSNPRDKSLGLNAGSPAVVGLDIAWLDLFGQSGRTNLHDPNTNLIEQGGQFL